MFGKLLSAILASAAPVQDAAPEPIELRYVPPEELEIELPPVLASPQEWAEVCEPWDDWDKPAPPFKVHGNTYYVGTCGIAAILVIGTDGHVLVDTGTKAGAKVALASIRLLGFDPKDIMALLHTHEHFDHVGGMAFMQSQTGARVVASHNAGIPLLFGNAHKDDPQYGMHDPMETVSSIEFLGSDWEVKLPIEGLKWIATPGHTPGALSWQWESCEGEICKTIVYADSLSPVSRDDYKFSDHPEYLAAYRAGIDRLAKLDCDILLTPHPSHSKMIERAKTGSFEGGVTCAEYAAGKHRDLDARLERETGANQ